MAAIAILGSTIASAGETEDKDAAKQIAAALRDSGKVQNYSIGVKYKDGTVWLAGRVTSSQQMTSALQVVSDIEGIEQIVNNLSIGPAPELAASARQAASAGSQIKQASAMTPANTRAAQRTPRAAGPSNMGGAPAGYAQLARAQMGGQMPGAQMGGQMAGGPMGPGAPGMGRPMPAYVQGPANGVPPVAYDQPHMPNHAWPSYAASPNYAAVTYPKQYSPTAWPFIGPFYPYPQVPLGWRKVSLEWDDGWWFLDFDDRGCQ